ncbi:hypothetical protein YSA_09738 [Pseudomonas putida ND6]|uniref:Uncharacterized protein n=1 Tax=Pseudomonas putida ND6 TaxID=231023 RepID=I3V2T3_PSEPU|nr:hypothetical protein YSA_09738 [Pseudomonas putida ND6]
MGVPVHTESRIYVFPYVRASIPGLVRLQLTMATPFGRQKQGFGRLQTLMALQGV